MKLTLALFLCYVTYVTASPTCTPEELRKCNSYSPRYIGSEETVEKYCQSVIKCSLDYWDKCGTSGSKYEASTYTWYKKINDGICEMPHPYRQKYIENSECLYGVIRDLPEECGMVNGHEHDKTKLCKQVEEIQNCSDDFIDKRCGKDGREVYDALYPDPNSYFGC